MAKVTLTDLANLDSPQIAVATINANMARIEAALEKTLSRDGTTPNSMTDELDMNSQPIINLRPPQLDTEPARHGDIQTYVDEAEAFALSAEEDAATVSADKAITIAAKNDAQTASAEAEGFRDEAEDWAGIASPNKLQVQNQTDDYTLVLTDAGGYIRINKSAPVNLTIPPNSSVAFDVGTVLSIFAAGTGQVTVVEGSGVTVNTPATMKLRAQNAAATLVKVDTDEWDLVGDLEAL